MANQPRWSDMKNGTTSEIKRNNNEMLNRQFHNIEIILPSL